MLTITAQNAQEVECHRFLAEASELGLPPGEFPRTIGTTLGNQQPFVLLRRNEEVAKYRQELGCLTLDILND